VWLVEELCRPNRALARGAVTAGVVAVGALSVLGFRQAALWQDSVTLFEHTLRCTDSNSLIEGNLGLVLLRRGDVTQAAEHFRAAIAAEPRNSDAHYNLGLALVRQGSPREAISQIREAVRLDPSRSDFRCDLGGALAQVGELEAARSELQVAVQLDPSSAQARANYGIVLMYLPGDLPEALRNLQEAARLAPDSAEIHNSLGLALAKSGRRDEAVSELELALRINPGFEKARRNLAHLQ
jgi:protein O-mannosyl-transferase